MCSPPAQFACDDRTDRQRAAAAWGNPAEAAQTKAASTLSLTCYTSFFFFFPTHFPLIHSIHIPSRPFASSRHARTLLALRGCFMLAAIVVVFWLNDEAVYESAAR